MFCLFCSHSRIWYFPFESLWIWFFAPLCFCSHSNTLKCNHLLSLMHSKLCYYPVFEKQAVCYPSLPSQHIWNWTLEGFNPPGGATGETQRRQIGVELRQQLQFLFFFFFLSQDSRGVKRSVFKVQPGEQRRKLSALFCHKPCITLHLSTSLLQIPAVLEHGNRCTCSTWKTPEDDTSHSGGDVLSFISVINNSDTSGETRHERRLNEHGHGRWQEIKRRGEHATNVTDDVTSCSIFHITEYRTALRASLCF